MSGDLIDLWRIVVCAVALWLALLVIRLAWHRVLALRADPLDDHGSHPLTYVSYAVALLAISVYRATALGTPFDSRLLVSTVIVLLGVFGVSKRVKFDLRPPSRRR